MPSPSRIALLRPLPLYVGAVCAGGLGVLAWAFARVLAVPPDVGPVLVALAACTVAAELWPLRMSADREDGEISGAAAFAFALLLTDGLAVAVLALTVASALTDLVRRRPLDRWAFNAGESAISLGAAAAVLAALGTVPAGSGAGLHPDDLPAVLLAAVCFFALNATLVSIVVALAAGVNPLRHLFDDLAFNAYNVGLVLAYAPVIVVTADFSVFALPLLVAPLLAVQRGVREAGRKEHESKHDSLTGLPNRVLFGERAAAALEGATMRGKRGALLLVDLDRFKEVNDTLGHHYGDVLLEQVAERLAAVVGPRDTVARLGGDEFAVVLADVDTPLAAEAVAAELVARAAAPFEVMGTSLQVGASVGVVCFPDDGTQIDGLLQHADAAMYLAKEARTGYERYSSARDDFSAAGLGRVGELRRAIEREELILHFQPKVDLASGRIHGVEALVRWDRDGELVEPLQFIELAERSGLIEPLTRWVLDAAVRQCAAWRASGLELRVAVNLSARSLGDEQLPELVAATLARRRLPPTWLEVEVTESAVAADPDAAPHVLERLRAMGVGVALDDFGTGYSSLSHAKALPVSTLKIDRCFLLDPGPADAAIVRAVAGLGRELGLRVVAEGAESEAGLALAEEAGCDEAQGFALCPPVPAAELVARVREHERDRRHPRRDAGVVVALRPAS